MAPAESALSSSGDSAPSSRRRAALKAHAFCARDRIGLGSRLATRAVASSFRLGVCAGLCADVVGFAADRFDYVASTAYRLACVWRFYRPSRASRLL